MSAFIVRAQNTDRFRDAIPQRSGYSASQPAAATEGVSRQDTQLSPETSRGLDPLERWMGFLDSSAEILPTPMRT
jgi:hypothetical protein